MRATGVIVRFLSLIDVALCLLGVLMFFHVFQAHRIGSAPVKAVLVELEAGLSIGFIPLYAGTSGDLEGQVFALELDNGQWKRGRRVVRRDDLEAIAKKLPEKLQSEARVLLLMSSSGFDRVWSDEKLRELEEKWGRRIVPVRHVDFPFER